MSLADSIGFRTEWGWRPALRDVIRAGFPLAGTPQTCTWCGEAILRRERHRHEKFVRRGTTVSQRWHLLCHAESHPGRFHRWLMGRPEARDHVLVVRTWDGPIPLLVQVMPGGTMEAEAEARVARVRESLRAAGKWEIRVSLERWPIFEKEIKHKKNEA